MASDEVNTGFSLWGWITAAGGGLLTIINLLLGREVRRVDDSMRNYNERIGKLEVSAVSHPSLERTITRVTTEFKDHVDTVAAGIHQRIDDIYRIVPKRRDE